MERVGFFPRLIAFIIDVIIVDVVAVVILGFFWSNTGQTPGKMLLRVEVISASDGGRIGVANAIVRLFGYLVNFMILGLGFLWIIWDKNKQGWHDKFARTYVVKK